MSKATIQIAEFCVERISKATESSDAAHYAWKCGQLRASGAVHEMEWYLTSVHVLANELTVLIADLDIKDGLSRECIAIRSRLAMAEISDHIHVVRIGELERVALPHAAK